MKAIIKEIEAMTPQQIKNKNEIRRINIGISQVEFLCQQNFLERAEILLEKLSNTHLWSHFAKTLESLQKENNDWVFVYYHLALVYFKLRKYDDAISHATIALKLFRSYANLPVEYDRTFEILGTALLEKRTQEVNDLKSKQDNSYIEASHTILTRLEKHCLEEQKVHGETYSTALFVGSIKFLRRELESAIQHLQKASSLDCVYDNNSGVFLPGNTGYFGVRNSQYIDNIDTNFSDLSFLGVPQLQSITDNHFKTSSQYVFFIAADANYFNKYALNLAKSYIIRCTGDIPIHFHIVNPDQNSFALVNQISGLLDSFSEAGLYEHNYEYNFTYEEDYFFECKTYYASSRFIRAWELIKKYERGVLIGDIDNIFHRDIKALTNRLDNIDICLNYSIDQGEDNLGYFPWRNIWAGCVFFANSKNGYFQAKRLAYYLADLIHPRSTKQWWIDQSALFSILTYILKFEEDVKILNASSSNIPKVYLHHQPGKREQFYAEISDKLDELLAQKSSRISLHRQTRKIFGIGLGKTGTKTLGQCMLTLGYNHVSGPVGLLTAYHQGEVDKIIEFVESKDSFDDFPWSKLYRELDLYFPNSLFILTLRSSPEKWFDSLCKHNERKGVHKAHNQAYGYDWPHNYPKEHMEFYENHWRDVIEYFKDRPEKLLVVCWEEGHGWERTLRFFEQTHT
jgi:tetratricopeptide (TPR) repeat protein